MFFSALKDRFDPSLVVQGLVLRPQPRRRTIYNDVDLSQQLLKRPSNLHSRPFHVWQFFRDLRIDLVTLHLTKLDPIVSSNIGDTDKFHVVLFRDSVSDSFSDNPESVYSYPDRGLGHFDDSLEKRLMRLSFSPNG